MYLFVLQLSLSSPPSQLCNVFAFPGYYQWCCRSCLSLHLNQMSLSHILERSSVGICLLCVGLVLLLWNSQRILLLCCLSITFFTRKPTPACPLLASEWYSRWPLWRLVKLSSFLRTSPSAITSHFMLFYFSSSSSSCTCSSLSNVLTLYVAIFSPSPLVWWFFFTQRFLAPPVCSLGGPEPPPRSQTSMLLRTGGFGLFVLCMLVFMAFSEDKRQKQRCAHNNGMIKKNGISVDEEAI